MTARAAGPAHDGRTPSNSRLKRFAAWLAQRGAEILPPLEKDVIRFRAEGVVSFIELGGTSGAKWIHNGLAAEAWSSFCQGSIDYHFSQTPLNYLTSNKTVIRIMRRDGIECFYCGDPFTPAYPPTKEHLVATKHGGPDNPSNLFCAHVKCNSEAGMLSAPEKIRLRDRKRAERAACRAAMAFELPPAPTPISKQTQETTR